MTERPSESRAYGYGQPDPNQQRPGYAPPQQRPAGYGQGPYGSAGENFGQGQASGYGDSAGQGRGQRQAQGAGNGQHGIGQRQGVGPGSTSGPNLPPGLFGQAQPHAEPTTPDERLWGALSHFGMIVLGFIAPLVVYLVKGNESRFVKDHAAQGLNFAITQTIYYFVNLIVFLFILGFLAFPIGLLTLPLQAIVALISVIVAGLAANRGERYRYPVFMALPIIKP